MGEFRRTQLITQFLAEAILMSLLALLIGLILAEFLLPIFNQLSEKELVLWLGVGWRHLVLFIVLILLAGILAGSYPALLLSAFRPTEILRNKFKFTGANFLSRALIIFQFAIVILLVISSTQAIRAALTNPVESLRYE